MRFVAFAGLDVAVAPKHQFFQYEKAQNAGQDDGAGSGGVAAADDGLRQYLEKCGPQQGANG